MSMLHSFYCWGHVGVVLLSTLFFGIFGIQNWKLLALIWALVPLCNSVLLAKVSIASLIEEGESGLTIKELVKQKIFWVFLLMMLCAGAREQAVSQWASTFAEKGLGVSKTVGDLAGPMTFAILMGASRAFYGKWGEKLNLDKFMIGSSILCMFSSTASGRHHFVQKTEKRRQGISFTLLLRFCILKELREERVCRKKSKMIL